MTLQERILEALGEQALKPRALYAHLATDMPAAIDCALGALMRSGRVSLTLGHYQRIWPGSRAPKGNGATATPSPSSTALTSNLTVPSAAVSATPCKTLGPVGVAPMPEPAAAAVATAGASSASLTARELEIAELAAAGKTNREIAQQLGLKLGTVEVYHHNIRKKTGGAKLERTAPPKPAPKSPAAPIAAPKLTAVPSREGAEGATVGAALSPKEAPRSNGTRPALPAGLKARLVEVQRRKAQELQDLLDQIGVKRQELADVEAMVRIVSEGGVA